MDLRARSGAGLPDGYLDFWSSVGDPTEHVKKRHGPHGYVVVILFFWRSGGGVIENHEIYETCHIFSLNFCEVS